MKPGTGTSQTPRKLNPKAKTTAASVTLNAVLLNCSPQPSPANTANVASTSITDINPAE